jgi:glycosyltransferase involved in cell wall biosynthesis
MSDARLTVLMPVREYHAAYLDAAVGSILGQTSSRWRLIVIDDGAGAALPEVLGDALGDDRVLVAPSDAGGLASALNTGMRHAGTEFISVLFADDAWAPNAVETFTSTIERFEDIDVFYGSRMFIDEQARTISGVYRARGSFTLADFQVGSPVKHPFCWRRDLALELGGFDESLDPIGMDDYDFPWSLAEAGARFMAVPDCLYLVRDHRDVFRLTTHIPRSVQLRTLRRIMGKHGMERARIESRLNLAKQGHLRQCLYRSPLDRWLKRLLRHDPRRGWRESYQ